MNKLLAPSLALSATIASLIAASPLARANGYFASDAEFAGFCEDKKVSYESGYTKSVASLEAESKTLPDLGGAAKAAIIEAFSHYKEALVERINKYADEVNAVEPKALQKNDNYLIEMLDKHHLSSELNPDRYGALRMWASYIKAHEVQDAFKSAIEELAPYGSGYSSSFRTFSPANADAVVRLGKVLKMEVSVFQGRDGSNRSLRQKAILSLTLTRAGLDVKVEESKSELSVGTVSMDQYVKAEFTKNFPECLEVLKLK